VLARPVEPGWRCQNGTSSPNDSSRGSPASMLMSSYSCLRSLRFGSDQVFAPANPLWLSANLGRAELAADAPRALAAVTRR
jgi:hypothetical protein